jgi:hypothetical protein
MTLREYPDTEKKNERDKKNNFTTSLIRNRFANARKSNTREKKTNTHEEHYAHGEEKIKVWGEISDIYAPEKKMRVTRETIRRRQQQQ